MDLDQPYLSTGATQYYQLARAAFSLDSILENQSILAIQALVSKISRSLPQLYSDIHGVLLIISAFTAPHVPIHVLFVPGWSTLGFDGACYKISAECQ